MSGLYDGGNEPLASLKVVIYLAPSTEFDKTFPYIKRSGFSLYSSPRHVNHIANIHHFILSVYETQCSGAHGHFNDNRCRRISVPQKKKFYLKTLATAKVISASPVCRNFVPYEIFYMPVNLLTSTVVAEGLASLTPNPARVRSPVGKSCLDEVFSGFSLTPMNEYQIDLQAALRSCWLSRPASVDCIHLMRDSFCNGTRGRPSRGRTSASDR
ncbi:hypothetical protein ANN_24549 [Periplaneta americana]|uniref:Uncharacterized protein n=1 Tax=Periplaneta americana TaxID=6978 RepID=A0ABQ8S3N8_PERAM|nr:hypothetical protein ANN_24549 [Periplaneta americana]